MLDFNIKTGRMLLMGKLGNKRAFQVLMAMAITSLCAIPSSAQDIDFSINSDLIRLQDFQDMRSNVFKHGIEALENNIVSAPEEPAAEEKNIDPSIEEEDLPPPLAVTATSPTEDIYIHKPSLKERRIAAHDKWRLMTEEEKEKMFEDVTPEIEKRVQERLEFLRTRLELRPQRGKAQQTN